MSQHIKVCDSVRSVNEDLLYSPTRSHLIDSSAQLQIAPLLHYSALLCTTLSTLLRLSVYTTVNITWHIDTTSNIESYWRNVALKSIMSI